MLLTINYLNLYLHFLTVYNFSFDFNRVAQYCPLISLHLNSGKYVKTMTLLRENLNKYFILKAEVLDEFCSVKIVKVTLYNKLFGIITFNRTHR